MVCQFFWGLGSGLTLGDSSERLAVFSQLAFLGFLCIQRIRLGCLVGVCLVATFDFYVFCAFVSSALDS